MSKKVVTVTIDGRAHDVTYDKKVKNLMVEYTVRVHDIMLKQKGVAYYRFHVYSKNVVFPDGTKSPVEKKIKQEIATSIVEAETR
jgi:hypothetical protein